MSGRADVELSRRELARATPPGGSGLDAAAQPRHGHRQPRSRPRCPGPGGGRRGGRTRAAGGARLRDPADRCPPGGGARQSATGRNRAGGHGDPRARRRCRREPPGPCGRACAARRRPSLGGAGRRRLGGGELQGDPGRPHGGRPAGERSARRRLFGRGHPGAGRTAWRPRAAPLFSLLPPDNATGNFVKIVQRVPVKITLPAGHTLLGRLVPGLSVDVAVEVGPSPGTAAAAEPAFAGRRHGSSGRRTKRRDRGGRPRPVSGRPGSAAGASAVAAARLPDRRRRDGCGEQHRPGGHPRPCHGRHPCHPGRGCLGQHRLSRGQADRLSAGSVADIAPGAAPAARGRDPGPARRCLGAAAAGGLGVLVAWRIAQGVAGAVLLVAGQSLLFQVFPRSRQGLVQAVFAFATTVAPTTLSAGPAGLDRRHAVLVLDVPGQCAARPGRPGGSASRPARRDRPEATRPAGLARPRAAGRGDDRLRLRHAGRQPLQLVRRTRDRACQPRRAVRSCRVPGLADRDAEARRTDRRRRLPRRAFQLRLHRQLRRRRRAVRQRLRHPGLRHRRARACRRPMPGCCCCRAARWSASACSSRAR